MRNLELDQYSVSEMDPAEISEFQGGTLWLGFAVAYVGYAVGEFVNGMYNAGRDYRNGEWREDKAI